jgi:glucose/arabinose dehydrogenase
MNRGSSFKRTVWVILLATGWFSASACKRKAAETVRVEPAPAAAVAKPPAGCDEGNGGIALPAGFCASVFADNLGHTRHIAAGPNGDLYANTWSSKYNQMTNAPGGFVVAMRDADREGHAEMIERFGPTYQEGKPGGGTGIAVHDGALYVEVDDNRIVRYPLSADALAPRGEPTVVLKGLPTEGDHPMHPFAITPDGILFVNSGSPSNACQVKNRQLESPGKRPCRDLATRAGIWRYDAKKTGQIFSPAARFATGMRNTVAPAVHDGSLYAAVQGRDQLHDNWPKLYTVEQQNELPAETFGAVQQGDDLGWPYCYFDAQQGKHVLAPEYGGDGGKAVGDCAAKKIPEASFPAHWAPEAVVFYTGSVFPESFRGGAFISFHGSWNRSPTQAGYLVAFVPFAGGKASGPYQEFATGFPGVPAPADPKEARHRPMGLAVGPDGALYVSDDVKGRIWRIIYTGPA